MSKAKEIIIPQKKGIFRIIFLYVGQGDATLCVIPDDENNKYLLIDSNLDKENEGIDLIKLLSELIDDKLDIFLNTHPHKDHLRGIKEIYKTIGIKEIWHSGHKPSKDHDDEYKELKYVMEKVGNKNVYVLKGSESENKLDDKDYTLGDINFNVLAPAEYVSDEIEDEKPEKRYTRIHEQCGVIRFSFGTDPARILITGDSDLCAWKEHITEYHKDRIPSNVLSASHHGSRTFFKDDKDDEVYKDHMDNISPSYVIVSAPKQSESKHDHPHDDAIKIYEEYVEEKDNVIHLGNYKKKRVSVIVDIDSEGNLNVNIDEELWNEYKFKKEGNDDDKKDHSIKSTTIIAPTKIDSKPMGL